MIALDAQATSFASARVEDSKYKYRYIHLARDPLGVYGLWEGVYTLEPFTDLEWFEAADRDGRVEWAYSGLREWYYESWPSFRETRAVDSENHPWRPVTALGVQREKDERRDRTFQQIFDIAFPLVIALVCLLLLRSCFTSSSGGSYDSYDPDASGNYAPLGGNE